MRAIRIHGYGNASVLAYEDADVPKIADDDILVRVVAASVNPVDWKIREGHLSKMIPYQMPLILGWDVAGVVDALGNAVTDFKVGDAVFSRPDIKRNGTYAEYVSIRASEAAHAPKTISYQEAASLPLAGITAWELVVSKGNTKPGQKVLVHAASGGVGSLAVQLAKWRGAHVVATTSADNMELVRSLGADEVIDYRAGNFAEKLRDVDLVVDTLDGAVQEASWLVLKPGGLLISSVGEPSAERAKAARARGQSIFIGPDAAVLAQLTQLVDSGKLRPIIGGQFALKDTAKAHALSETGRTVGKIVLYVGQP
jgi:NADPH:quinone reductase-like Zn-dependent oxidoreductase